MGGYELEGLGFDYLEKWINSIKDVSVEDVKRVANKYLDGNYVLTILAPEDAMNEV